MGDLTQAKFHENEIAKSEDFNFVSQSEVSNLESIIHKMTGEAAKACIIRGLTVKQRATPSMNVDIEPGIAVTDEGELIFIDILKGPIPVENGGASDRIDVVEVRRIDTDYDTRQRAFKDPASGSVTYQDVDTKIRTEIEVQVLKGTPGFGSAPGATAASPTRRWRSSRASGVSAGTTPTPSMTRPAPTACSSTWPSAT